MTLSDLRAIAPLPWSVDGHSIIDYVGHTIFIINPRLPYPVLMAIAEYVVALVNNAGEGG